MDTTNLELIHRMFEAFGTGASRVNKGQINEYVRQIDGRPHTHVKRVVEKFIDGQIAGQSLDFPPPPAKFGNALLLEPYYGQEEQAWAKARIVAHTLIQTLPAPEEQAPKMTAKTAKGMQQLAESLKTPEDQ